MTMLLRPGKIRILATIADGVVQQVAIESDRPVALVAAMAGRPASEAARMMAGLHGLCGRSHAAAVQFAAAAAAGAPVPPHERAACARRLVAERIGEHLRTLFLAGAMTADPGLVRQALALAARLVHGEGDPGSLAGLLRRLCPDILAPEPDGTDVLRCADDAAIIAALRADAAFARAPALPDRHPQTGPAARFGAAATPANAVAARYAELHAAAGLLADSRSADPPIWVDAGPAGPDAGYAAVETPRGRLHYWLRLNRHGTVRDARSLAPTEWHFHPSGPLPRALAGSRPEGDPAAAITRVAAAFDPCVAFHVTVREAADA